MASNRSMRTTRNLLALGFLVLVAFWCDIVWTGCSIGKMVYDPKGYHAPPPRRSDPDSRVFASYHKWERLTAKPVPIVSAPSGFCSASPVAKEGATPGSLTRFHQVYVNEIGMPGMESSRSDFSEGSIIVKEELSDPKRSSPDLVLAMVKREEGFNPGAGDWEFFILHQRERTIVDRGRLEHCQSCHVQAREHGYLFRHLYVPPGPRKARWTIF